MLIVCAIRFDIYDYCETVLLLYIVTTLVNLPEDGNCAETCSSKLIVKYVIYGIVHVLVLMGIVNQFTVRGKVYTKGTQTNIRCIISLFTAQHVSNVSTSIFRSLRFTVDLFHVLYC